MKILFMLMTTMACQVQAQWFGARNQPNGPPSRIYRARITMTASKQFMDVSFSQPQIFDFYNFNVRWAEPFQWNDLSASGGGGRRYQLHCWVRDRRTGETKNLFSRDVNSLYTGYHEKLRFPPNLDLSVQCEVQAVNALQKASGWALSNVIRVQDIPVYLPGIPNVDVRGFSNEDIISVLSKIAAEYEEYQDNSESIKQPITTTRHINTRRHPTTTRPITTTTTPRPTTTTTRPTTTSTTTQQSTSTTAENIKWRAPIGSVEFRGPLVFAATDGKPVFRPAVEEENHNIGQVRKIVIANNWQSAPINTDEIIAQRAKESHLLTEEDFDRQVEKLRRRHTNYILGLDN